MTFARHDHFVTRVTLPRLPSWVTSIHAKTSEDVAFLSGAALNHLHLMLNWGGVSQTLLRERLAMPRLHG